MADGFQANAVFFKLGFLDSTKVALGMQLPELMPILWMKAGAFGPCPSIQQPVPGLVILPENKMAVLTDESNFSVFVQQLAQYPEISTVYLATDYAASFAAMAQLLEGRRAYQLYRDYLDHFRFNAGRNGR